MLKKVTQWHDVVAAPAPWGESTIIIKVLKIVKRKKKKASERKKKASITVISSYDKKK